MRFILYLTAGSLIFFSCGEKDSQINKFSDPTLQKIGELQDRRSSDSLVQFLNNENAAYRKNAALAFASIQDSSRVDLLSKLLTDPDTAVRKASAFAIGQTNCRKSEQVLEKAISSEKNSDVLNALIENFGRVTRKWKMTGDVNDKKLNPGRAWSLYRAGLNNAVDDSGNIVAATYLNKTEAEKTRVGAAHFFARSGKEIGKFLPQLSSAALDDPSADVRMASAYALRKIKTDSAFMTLESVLKNEKDYRVKVNAVRAIQVFPFEKTKDYLLRALNDKNVNVGIASSEAIKSSVTENFWVDLANRVTDILNWRIQANVYEAILKVKENPDVLNEIKSNYRKSTNPYQKAALLTALSATTSSIDFITDELFKADTPVPKTYAAAAIVAINQNPKFKSSDKNKLAEIYTRGIKTGEVGIISVFASVLADSARGYKSVIKDFGFLNEAKQKLSLPRDNEILQSLEQAIALFEGRKSPNQVHNEFNHPIDWTFVKTIPADQRVVVKTTKGNITLRLLVDEAPGSVANFLSLAQANYFDQKFFHRVVPNFVIQGGCNRGDGLGSEDYSIRSEFSQRGYTTGSVGMASAGKDTEGTQWFITHSPTPHLDGRYTIFAVVEKGMEAVHQIEVGDQITDVEIVDVKAKK
jgi:cyclophilin family peptidyl-prolyl cis-trans isomerase/HEAT repeat protein